MTDFLCQLREYEGPTGTHYICGKLKNLTGMEHGVSHRRCDVCKGVNTEWINSTGAMAAVAGMLSNKETPPETPALVKKNFSADDLRDKILVAARKYSFGMDKLNEVSRELNL